MRGSLTPCVLAVLAACGFPRPDHVGDDDAGTDAPIDAELPPGKSIRVSGTGDDANDGITAPVKTLKHAIGLAAANPEITSIVLATGRYSAAGGETFPYSVPRNVLIVGPAGGGAVLVGSKTEPGINVSDGALRDLELEDFTVAITATGNAMLANLHVRTEKTAIRAGAIGTVSLVGVDIAGAVGVCAGGLEVTGSARVTAEALSTRNLGAAIFTKDETTVEISNALLMGDLNCDQPAVEIRTAKAFTATDSVLDAGKSGLLVRPDAGTVAVTLIRTTLRNFKTDGIVGSGNFGGAIDFRMMGGELSANGLTGAQFFQGGTWVLTDVTIKQNAGSGIYFQDTALTLRRCKVTGNGGDGVETLTPVAADFGTAADPGGNTFQNNRDVGVGYEGGIAVIEAVGNTWNPSAQGANANGVYASTALVSGPVPAARGNNYWLSCDAGMCAIRR